jgi:hypothetical protein
MTGRLLAKEVGKEAVFENLEMGVYCSGDSVFSHTQFKL